MYVTVSHSTVSPLCQSVKKKQQNAGKRVIYEKTTIMRQNRFSYILILFLALVLSFPAVTQTWSFVKEKDGIKIYTCKEAGKSLKSYKGITDIQAPAEKVFAMIEDVYHTEWWDKNLNQIKVLKYEKFKMAQYYLIYDLPWPVTDRDLCVDVTSCFDPVKGEGTVTAGPLPGIIPESKEMVRIKDYHQTWTVKSAGKESSHVVLVGFVDPAGSIPDWVSNMVIVNSPIKAISAIKLILEKK
jgi:hypothetical protein